MENTKLLVIIAITIVAAKYITNRSVSNIIIDNGIITILDFVLAIITPRLCISSNCIT